MTGKSSAGNESSAPRLFEQVRAHVGAHNLVAFVEADLDVLPEPRTVVVARRLRVADRLQQHGADPVTNLHSVCTKHSLPHLHDGV